MTWLIFALVGAICFTLYSLVVRRFLANRGDAQIFALLCDFTVGVLLLVVARFDQLLLDLSPQRLLLLGLSSALYAGASALIFWGRQLEQVSVASVVKQTTTIWVFTGGIVLLGEGFSVSKLLSISLIVAGTLLAIWERGHLRASKGIVLLLLGSLLGSVSSLIDKTLVTNYVAPALYAGIVSLLAAVWLFLALPDSARRVRAEAQLQTWHIPVVGFWLGLSLFCLMKGFQYGEASLVVPVYQSSVILGVLAGIVVLDERDRIGHKLVGSVVAFSGVVVLAVA